MKSRFLSICAGAAVLIATGCGKPPLPGPPPCPVHAKVVYRGQPAKGFRVTFYPLFKQGKTRFAPAALTDAVGEFRLQSYHRDDGAPKGEYAVTFAWPNHINTGEEADPLPEVDQLEGRYSDPKKSQFKIVVHEGENELPPFVLP
jgi:5-hydroxyisourate hydrolase-like protein (transthyretin family)